MNFTLGFRKLKEDKELTETTERIIGECSEGFDFEAEFLVHEKVFESYVNYLADIKKQQSGDVNAKTMRVLNKLIESKNIGSAELVKVVNSILAKKFKPQSPSRQLITSITTALSKVNPKYTTHEVRTAMESFKTTDVNADDKGLAIGEYFFNKYGAKVLGAFPSDFVEYLGK